MVAIKLDTTIQPGGVISVHSDELPPGARAQVIILVDAPQTAPRTLSSFLCAAKGGFQSPADVDAFLRAERDAWER